MGHANNLYHHKLLTSALGALSNNATRCYWVILGELWLRADNVLGQPDWAAGLMCACRALLIVLTAPVTRVSVKASTWLHGRRAAIVIWWLGSRGKGASGRGGRGNKNHRKLLSRSPVTVGQQPSPSQAFSDHTGESTQKRTPPWVFIIWRRHTVSTDVRGGCTVVWTTQ